MRILAIETSCDETAIALLDIDGPKGKPEIQILGNSLFSQSHLHEQYGGVYPHLAKREHLKNLPILLEKTLKEAGESIDKPNIDYIAVTQGPGLEPALWTGINFAENLSSRWQKPVVPVDHMEGHMYSVLYQDKFTINNLQFTKLEMPALALLVSGGHTELVFIKDFGQYEILGRTRDDAVGEAFDKVARMLDLPYPGGPKISELAAIHRNRGIVLDYSFPKPMVKSHNLDFSYSGLKTAVLYKLKGLNLDPAIPKEEKLREEIARAFEDAAIGVLIEKTRLALKEHQSEIKTVIVGGGVAGNTYLQSELGKLMGNYSHIKLLFPPKSLSTDNAVMIGIAGYIRISLNPKLVGTQKEIIAKGNLSL